MARGRKITGGKYKKMRKKKLYEISGQRRIIILGEEKKKKLKMRGGKQKIVLLKTNQVNVYMGKGKMKKVKIKNVVETPSNKFLARQNIINKGAIVETELGKVRITNRPSQEGQANGILVEE
jgi:small subunit ribosomal protein S8e